MAITRIIHAAAMLLPAVVLLSSSLDAQLKDPLISPVIGADRAVTLSLRAPEADSVKATGGFPGSPAVMKKGANGIWSVKIGPLDPGVYFYSFSVNGVTMIDPSNRNIHMSVVPSSSMFIIPGTPPLVTDERDIPRGAVHRHRHKSKTLGDYRGYNVYTPPGYDASKSTRYPVLYLLHGYTDTEESWSASGRANVILDNLIYDKAAVPMIIVMPYGYAPEKPGDGEGSWEDWFSRVTPRVEEYVVKELIPLIDRDYRTMADQKSRAVAGLSMGGGQTIRFGLNNTDTFAWVGAFSSAVYEKFHGPLLDDTAKLNRSLKLLFIGCGRDDFLYENNTTFIKALDAKGIKNSPFITAGAHTWPVWHSYLKEFSSRIFKDGK